ncbi:MAG: hypothetical protein ACKVW3_11270 [Phycisphaerales bacterium]
MSLLDRLLGTRSLSAMGEGVQFGFARPLPPWGWVVVVLLAAALGWWSYRRLPGLRGARFALASLRALFLMVLIVLISGPQLVRPNERVERDWLLVLVDRSASLAIADAPEGGTRDAQLRAAVTQGWPTFDALAKDRTVLWLGFDSGVRDLPAASGPVDLGEHAGRRTALGESLNQALSRAAARPIAGVVVMSDGRSIDEPARAALRRLQTDKIPVFTLALGSDKPVADLGIRQAQAPSMAFLDDTVPVEVEIERLGDRAPPPGQAGGGGVVQLIDKLTSAVIDERPIPAEPERWADQRAGVTLTSRPRSAGQSAWIVRIVPAGADLIPDNNQAPVAVEVVDRPLRVAYFDGYPRWEYRYVKDLLVREQSIESAIMLLASNRRYIQEGDVTLDALPRSPEEWARFDVVVLGDLPASLFSRDQLEQVRDLVATRGAGLLWIAGTGSTPGSWRDSPLADLVPFFLGAATSSGTGVPLFDEPVLITPTPAADRLNILRLGDTPDEPWPARLKDPRAGWSQLRVAQRIDPAQVKPGTEVLATFTPVSRLDDASAATPAVLSMRYGAGRVLYVATDETWRWRYARGEILSERFWLPLIRLQGRESLSRSSKPAMLEAFPRRAVAGQPVRLVVSLLDQSLIDRAPPGITLRSKRQATDEPPVPLTLAPESSEAAQAGSKSYATSWTPTEPGTYRVEAADSFLSSSSLAVTIEVGLADDELRRPDTDHPLLARLSEQTGGQTINATQISMLPDLLPKRERRIVGIPDIEPLWDKPLVLLLLLTLLTLEWVVRRLIHLT